MKRVILAMLIGVTLAGFPAGARAQDQVAQAQTRSGLWFSGGLGYGALGCKDCSGRTGGLTGNVALGGTISQHLLLGAAWSGWTRSENGATLSVGALIAEARVYPSASGRFFLEGGLGLGVVSASLTGFGSQSKAGAAAVLGIGYDARIGQHVSLTPYWEGVGVTFSGGDANFGDLGLAVTLY